MKLRVTPIYHAVVLALATVIAACTVGPEYKRPEIAAPAEYREAKDWKVAEPRDGVPRGKWWMIFGDPLLNDLADKVEVSNQTLRVAEAQYRRAQALVQAARAGLYPTVTAGASVDRSSSGSTSTSSSSAGRRVSTNYDLSANASWEIDLWGRVRKSVESSEAEARATAADLESVRLSLQSELVINYLQLRVLDTQRQLLDETAAAFDKSLQLTRNRYDAGLAGKVDLVQAEAQLKSTQAQAIDIGVQRAQFEHAIAVLLGKPPAEFTLPSAPINVALPVIPTGLPSELLERRPDVAAAERRVASANAQIGVAQAAFFPSLELSAAAGFQSSSFARWLTAPARFWSLGPALAQTLFDAGLRRSLSDQAIASYDANVATYRQKIGRAHV